MNIVGEKIKKIRELRNFTQEYMADRLEMTQAGYSKIERGQTDLSMSKLDEIAKVLEVRVEDILLFDQQKFFNSFNNVEGSNNGSVVIINGISQEIKALYEDKIRLLEKLMEKQEPEFNRHFNLGNS
jgi:transcriptional regulator with XRE-family HTH domain